jgi:hypothetical protein
MRWVSPDPLPSSTIELKRDLFAGLGKTLQMISLIVTDDTGEGVLETPEDPDERFDDMTLIGESSPFVPLDLR